MDGFDERFHSLFRRAYGIAFVILGNRAEAEDVAQEALARALARWSTVAPYADAWVARVTGNLAIDRTRRLRRGAPGPARRGPDVDADRVDLQRALRRLPRRQREVVVLRYFAEFSEQDVAHMLGCSVGTVKTHAHRALNALRDILTVP